ncbi:MAG: proline--tRNA ligase [Nevskiaceae bacterium]|nr:MAG: proline--tRNA ligase [Nevskiaceae bacterium]TBR73070.1 MAG: proline--tRNA ligase [Nevskiaceae bacterium]
MRLSRFALVTTKETPADAEVVSHKLMLRAGMIRKLGAGLYSWLPIGLRVLYRVEAIIREEMDRAGANEIRMPGVIPAELWQESGRWQKYGPELLRFKDRHDRDFVLGPTHEEVVTDLIRRDIRSYKQLPVNLYQIQTKFRDEIRPRFGVMRGREFIMKDAYSFHVTQEDLDREYLNMRDTYTRIFTRIGVEFRIVRADTGAIGGKRSEEFQVLAAAGEDLLAVSDTSDYAANIEAAACLPHGTRPAATAALQAVSTPGHKTCADVATFLKLPMQKLLKLLVVHAADGGLIALALRADHELNEVKAEKHPRIASPLVMATDAEIRAAFGCQPGFLGPVGCKIPVLADHAAAVLADFTCGANQDDAHLSGTNWGRDTAEPETADLRNAVAGDPSPDGQGMLTLTRGIEVGQIFENGPIYTAALGVKVLGEDGQEFTPTAGCYGIGVTRVVAAVIEQRNDDRGILWPDAIAPFRVIICPIGMDKNADVKAAAEALHDELQQAGVDVALDDRGLRPGAMFADADLIGIPHRIVIGDRGLKNAQFEYKRRDAAEPEMIAATTAAVLEKLRA